MKRSVSIILAVIMVLSLCACGKNTNSAAAASESGYSNTYNTYYESAAYDTADAAPMAMTAVSGSGSPVPSAKQMSSNGTASEGDSSEDSIRPEKIIYSASATVETIDFDTTIKKLEEMITACGGFVESSSMNDNTYYRKSRGYSGGRSADYTIRVPGTVFNDVVSGLSDLGNVPYSYVYSQNITSQYYDLQARLDAYKAQEQRLLELMERAETIDDIIAVEERLTDVRYSIDSMQASLINYDRKVSYSTIDLHIEEVSEYTPSPTVTLSFGEKLVNAVCDGLSNAAEFLEDLVLWLAEALPTLVILAVLVLILLVPGKKAFKALRARAAARKAKRAEKKAEKKAAGADNKE